MRSRRRLVRSATFVAAVLLAVGSARLVAAQADASGPAATQNTGVSQADLTRIKQALQTTPTLNLGQSQLRYYVRILAMRPEALDFMKGYDFKNGPTRGGNPMTHQEFLAMVTPKEMNSSGGITAMETLQFAFTNWLGQTLVKKAIEDIHNAKSEREIQEIRDRIERELSALKPPAGSN